MQISETVSSQIIYEMVVRTKALMEEIFDHEDFEIIASSHKAGTASKNPRLLMYKANFKPLTPHRNSESYTST